MSKPLVLLYCGSFSPISVAHLRSIEVGKNYLEKQGYTVTVIISPVGDAYKKKDLLPAAQRIEILQLAAKNSDYIQVSDWESKREEYTRTLLVLQHFSEENPGVPVRLLCGSDLLESFNMPGVWADEDMEAIVKDFGLIVLTRGDNIDSTIEACKHLANYKANIAVIADDSFVGVSSTKIRNLLREGKSIKYLTPDPVVEYLETHKLFQ